MSDSEEDFMSDKFLTNIAPAAVPIPKSYTAQRQAQQLKSLRMGQAKNIGTHKQIEEERRREGLSRSLFSSEQAGESSGSGPPANGGGNKALDMMKKMGWKVGEGLGRERSPSPPRRAPGGSSTDEPGKDEVDEEGEEGRPRGLGSRLVGRTEPIRVSMWAGRKGLAARDPSPPPLPSVSGRNPDALDARKMARLGNEVDGFRQRQGKEFGEREVERKGGRAREMLVRFDGDKGVKFHPLHVLPSDPLGTLPKPLLKLIYPSQALSPSPSSSRSPSPKPIEASSEKEKIVSAAERLREQMKRDMLTEAGGDEDEIVSLGKRKALDDHGEDMKKKVVMDDWDGMDWGAFVSGTKKVLSMEPRTYLTFVIDQLRHEHLFCFWCAYKYKSWQELEAPGGCPGEDEDDH